MITQKVVRAMVRCIACAILMICQAPVMAAPIDFHDWTAVTAGGITNFSSTSAAGTITSVNAGGFSSSPGTFGVPTVITSKKFTTEFQIHGINGLNAPIDFVFSPGYKWGSGGELLLGNIHNYYQYTLSAWDFGNNPIDVNTWTTPPGLLAEYPSTAAGTLGYFSTSSTSRAAADMDGTLNALGFSTNFSVNDPSASASGGQGGVLAIGGLINVGMIELTLTSSNLGANPQQVDFILFNVGTPLAAAAPEPATILLFAAGVLGMVAGRCRQSPRRQALQAASV